jgi:hypothetical protein
VTRQSVGVDVDYSATANRKWSGGNFNGLGILNNSYDVPQVWIPSSYGAKVTDLPNWDANLRCQVMRPFKNFLVALNLTKSGTPYPTAIRWSHPADPASVPISWDITDETKDAGEWYFNRTAGHVVELVPLRNEGLIYKTDSIHAMQYIGGVFVFKFREVSGTTGIPSKNCAIEFKPGQHFAWTGDDIIVTDGQTITSILTNKNRKMLQFISNSTYEASFCLVNELQSEVWFCYAEDANPTKANMALIWNWQTGAWGMKDLSLLNYAATGIIDPTPDVGVTWNADSEQWDLDSSAWGDLILTRSRAKIMGCKTGKMLQLEVGADLEGVAYTTQLERKSLGVPFKQDKPPDISSWKFCREIWPRFTGATGAVISISIGSQTVLGGPVTWQDPQNFTIGTTTKLNCTISGRLFALKFESTDTLLWTLNGYDLEVDYSGGY